MQNLTPLEIQKQTFSRGIKGTSPDEIRAYLHLVAEQIERLVRRSGRQPVTPLFPQRNSSVGGRPWPHTTSRF